MASGHDRVDLDLKTTREVHFLAVVKFLDRVTNSVSFKTIFKIGTLLNAEAKQLRKVIVIRYLSLPFLITVSSGARHN